MNKDLYIKLTCIVLESIRMDFNEDDLLQERKDFALLIVDRLVKEYPDDSDLKIFYDTIASFDVGKQDGRYFRDFYPLGYILDKDEEDD